MAHSDTVAMKPTTNEASTPVDPCWSEKVSPTRNTASPRAIISTSWQRSADRKSESWVTANTYTRSKNSSMLVTRGEASVSRWRRTVPVVMRS